MPSGSFAPWSVVVATPLCPLAVPAVDTFDPAGCVLCTTVVVTGRETVPPATLCPCRARFVVAERWEAADVVETEDNPETKPASAAACPKAPDGTAPRVKTSREPNTSFVLSIAIPLQLLHVRVINTQASPDAPRVCGLKVYSPKTSPTTKFRPPLLKARTVDDIPIEICMERADYWSTLFNLLLQFRSTGELC
jgi:hypothetical protein